MNSNRSTTPPNKYDIGDSIVVPASQINPGDVDKLLAKELNSLSLEDREFALEELHGVINKKQNIVTEIESHPDRVEQALQQLQNEIDSIENKPIYDYAIHTLNSQYVIDKQFRKKFLRVEKYDTKKAAIRLLKWFEHVYEIYQTDDVLMRPIRISDLNPNAIDLLKEGSYVLLANAPNYIARDTSGRQWIAYYDNIGKDYRRKDRVSFLFFFHGMVGTFVYQLIISFP
jgi:hypothetical protein